MAHPSIPLSELLSSVVSSASQLAQAEIRLFRAEMLGKLTDGLRPVILVAIASGLLFLGTFVLTMALVLWLISVGVEPFLAALGVAVAFLIAGGACLSAALSRFRRVDLTPARTLAQMREDAIVIKGEIHG